MGTESGAEIGQDGEKQEIIYSLLEEDINHSTSDLADKVGCSTRHVRRARAWFKDKLRRSKQSNFGVPVRTDRKAAVIADLHAPYVNEKALDIALDDIEAECPDTLVIAGDFLDCYAISYWKTDPTRMRFPDEIEEARKILLKISRRFPKARKVYLEGNHELRLRSFLWDKASKLYGLKALTIEELLDLDAMGWEYISNRELLTAGSQPFSLGKLFVVHGHEIRVSFSAVNIPRLYFYKALSPIMVAHHHTSQEFMSKRINHTYACAWSIGCLCDLSTDYAPMNNWNAGYAIVKWDSDGDFAVTNKKIINGKVG